MAHGDVQFIAVGTPPDEDGSADLQYVLAAARNIGKYMNGFKVVVDKSTVPVGTADKVTAAIQEELDKRGRSDLRFSVVSNPEFLKEGAAVEDFMRPDRIVIGYTDDETGREALAEMRKLYAPFNRNHERTRVMDVRSAEFAKYAANAMLATRISFMNELANLADRVGADIEAVRQGIGSDPRIGYSFLYAGTGYGGSCFPKDIQALTRIARDNGQALRVLESVEAVNDEQKRVLTRKVLDRFGPDLSDRTFALWGLAFKPNTDDMREAPSRVRDRRAAARRRARGGARPDRGRRDAARAQARLCRRAGAAGTHQLLVGQGSAGSPGRRGCADHRHRVEGLSQSQPRAAQDADEVAGDLRRPQPLRAGHDEGSRRHLPGHRAQQSLAPCSTRSRSKAGRPGATRHG